MKLSVIIVNWNTKLLLQKCLESLFRFHHSGQTEIFVVDNASDDGSAELVERYFPLVHLIKNKTNLGFAKANNQGMRLAKGDYILLLNQDTELWEDSFSSMLGLMERAPDIGILGPKLIYADKSWQPSCRRFPMLVDQIFILLKLHNLFPNLLPIRRYYLMDFDPTQEQEVEQLMGAAMMIRRAVMDQIGLFDEEYFFWFEEVDYCKRARDRGWKIVFTAKTAIIHHKGKSQSGMPDRQKRFNASLLRYFKKHHSYSSYLLLRFLHPISLCLAYLLRWVLKLHLPWKILQKNRDL